jgi:hypothetical protein
MAYFIFEELALIRSELSKVARLFRRVLDRT